MQEKDEQGTINESDTPKRAREVSRYAFPYYDLDVTISVAKALHDRAGGKASLAQLAAYLGHTDESSGAYRSKVWGAQLFGLVTISSNSVSLESLGQELAYLEDGLQRDRRMAQAFLNVPLFLEVYRKYEGSALPSSREGLKNAMQFQLGVPPKVAPVALKTLLASAEEAGFLRENPSRLIHPVPAGLVEKSFPATETDEKKHGTDMPSPDVEKIALAGVHPAISGFLQELSGEHQWSNNEQQRWLDAFVAMIKALYPSLPDERATVQDP